MGYWGWRSIALLMCLSVWVVSCTDLDESTPPLTPTNTPIETSIPSILHYIPPDPDPALPVVVTPDDSRPPLNVVATLIGVSVTPDHPLTPTTTTCYDLASGGILCLGQLTNPNTFPVTDIRLLTQLYDRDADLLRERVHTLAQRSILPGTTATFRVIFPPEDVLYLGERFGAVRTTVVSNANDTNPLVINLPTTVDRITYTEESQVTVTLRVSRTTSQPLRLLRLHISLVDPDGRVTAYRIVELTAAVPAPGEALTTSHTLTTQLIDPALTAIVVAEGFPAD